MIKLTLHFWLKLYLDQSDGLGFEIQDAWESAKEKLLHSIDHITVGWDRADWTLMSNNARCKHWRKDKAKY